MMHSHANILALFVCVIMILVIILNVLVTNKETWLTVCDPPPLSLQP